MDTRARTLAATQRELAQAELDDPALPGSPMADYRTARARATLAAVDWAEGRTAVAPATGDPVAADVNTMDRERLRAHELEAAACGGPGGWFPGVVEQTLACLLGRHGARPPFLG